MINTLKNLYELPVKSTVYQFGECINSESVSIQRVYQFEECISSDSISSKNVSVGTPNGVSIQRERERERVYQFGQCTSLQSTMYQL